MEPFILSIDQGTTSSRALLFNARGQGCFTCQEEFTQYFPDQGWVEHDPAEIWDSVLKVTRAAFAEAERLGGEVISIGITNQRETTVVWDRSTGQPLYNAIVWQDRRTAEYCKQLREQGHEAMIQGKTGLLLDPYFSATKIRWILENSAAGEVADLSRLAFGTIDSFLVWKLSGGRQHLTDATNASRTLLFDIHTQQWDRELAELFGVPPESLPEVRDCSGDFGYTDAALFGREIPIGGIAGDQQAALIGQACFQPGVVKSTYGTGCFMVMNTGNQALKSDNKLLTTVGYRLNGETVYALEGSIFVAGSAVQWLRDQLNVLSDASESEALAASLQSNEGVYIVPAFTGLGAPHWNPHARGTVFGLTRDTGKAALTRAALESVAYQTHDVLSAMEKDGGKFSRLRVDGGMANNDWFCQFLGNILGIPVDRPVNTETTALGAACLAGLHSGLYDSLEGFEQAWLVDRSFDPDMETTMRDQLLSRWQQAVQLTGQFEAVQSG